jgi:hypothetical protein
MASLHTQGGQGRLLPSQPPASGAITNLTPGGLSQWLRSLLPFPPPAPFLSMVCRHFIDNVRNAADLSVRLRQPLPQAFKTGLEQSMLVHVSMFYANKANALLSVGSVEDYLASVCVPVCASVCGWLDLQHSPPASSQGAGLKALCGS